MLRKRLIRLIYELLILVLAVPVGFLLAWLGRDELIEGRVCFRILIITSILGGAWFFLIGQRSIGYTFGFVLIISVISFVKSFDKKWAVKRKI